MKFRTYKRRDTTRESGFHTSGETTGSECKIVNSLHFHDKNKVASLKFYKKVLKLVNIFNLNKSLLALGFFIFPECNMLVNINLKYTYKKIQCSVNYNQN